MLSPFLRLHLTQRYEFVKYVDIFAPLLLAILIYCLMFVAP